MAALLFLPLVLSGHQAVLANLGATDGLPNSSGATAGLPSSAKHTATPREFTVTSDTRDESILRQLDPLKRASVLMAILGLVVLGLGLIVAVSLGSRYARRIGHRPKPSTRETVDDWFAKPLAPDVADRHDHDGR